MASSASGGGSSNRRRFCALGGFRPLGTSSSAGRGPPSPFSVLSPIAIPSLYRVLGFLYAYTLLRLYASNRRQSGNFRLTALGKNRVNALGQQRLHRRPFFGRDNALCP